MSIPVLVKKNLVLVEYAVFKIGVLNYHEREFSQGQDLCERARKPEFLAYGLFHPSSLWQ